SSDEATSSESIPAPRNDDPIPVAGESNRWCVEGQWQIYQDVKMINDKQKMARLITEERRVLTGSLHTVPDIHRLFNLHNCDWMARDPGTYIKEILKPLAQTPLTSTLVRGCPVDISPATIRRFLYGPTMGHSWFLNTAEFDYRWDIVQSGAFQRNIEQREAVILWLARYIATDGEHAEWVAAPRLGIRKATLNFMAKLFWLLVHNRVSPTKADNQVTWDKAGHSCSIGSRSRDRLCPHVADRDSREGIQDLHYLPLPECLSECAGLIHPIGALDIGLIRDEANVAAPHREPQV
ncbi:hypothetical protein H5410_050775, partial [Solanum commersonii]